MSTKTVVVWNPQAGRATASASLREELQRRPAWTVIDASRRDDVRGCVEAALRAGAERLYVAGGDGTVSAAVDALMRSRRRVPLGVIPTGTGNDFCRTLGVPLDPHEAVACLDTAPLRAIDVVQVDDRTRIHHFVNMVAGGNSDRLIDHATQEQKKWWGPLAYLIGALDAVRDLETYQVTVKADSGAPEVFEAWNLMLAGGKTSGGGIPIAPHSRPDDGMLDLVIVRSGTLPEVFEAGARLLIDTLLESELVEHRQSPSFTIESLPTMRFTADGDLVEWVPVRFQCCPGAIAMHVGPEFEPFAAGR